MSYIFLQERAGVSLVESFAAIPAYVLSRLNITAEKCYSKDSETESCQNSQSGTMCEHLTENLGWEKLTSFVEDSHVKELAKQTKMQQDLMMSEADYGLSKHVSLAKYDRDSRSWKTAQCLLFEDSTECLGTYPKWGIVVDGELLVVGTPAGCTNEIASGYLRLPTIGKNEFKGSSQVRFKNSKDFHGAKMSEALRTCKEDPTYLHPCFAEKQMNWPITWTESVPLEMDKFQQWLSSHGTYSAKDYGKMESLIEGVEVTTKKARKPRAKKEPKEIVLNLSKEKAITVKPRRLALSEICVKAQHITRDYALYNADCCEALKGLPDNCIDYSIFSPPFESLYTYSNSSRDMGNCKDSAAFRAHNSFLIQELFRVLKTGRNLSFHCQNICTQKARDGYIGIRDFRGDLIFDFQRAGFIYHSEVCIWKDPVTAMQRTKALGLLYKQVKKDTAMSRQGIPDYLVTMRKPGVNLEPITKKGDRTVVDEDDFTIDMWQKYASPIWREVVEDRKFKTMHEIIDFCMGAAAPVWFDINQGNTLQKVREDADERHICPLQIDVVERGVRLWTNPGDIVLTPFLGIGTEAFVARRMRRKAIGIELKGVYFQQAIKNLELADSENRQTELNFE